ncbi:putative phage protein [Firmicutes bacterium CAG:238]|nr:putative phage protein [Firmicutes bacterium CAG:238]
MASKFYIMNEKAVRYDLNSPEKGVFISPEGFGVAYSSDYLSVGNIWTADRRKLEQPTPSGKIIFPLKPYKAFNDFINFINTATGLVLVYQPAGIDKEYFADIDIVSVKKGGYNCSKFEVPVQFICKSLFYTSEKFEYHVERTNKEIRWDFRWETKFNEQNSVFFSFHNDGHAEAPFVLSFTGYCLNPAITVVQAGKLLHKSIYSVELQANERLEISTFDGDLYIQKNGSDAKSCLDFTQENFFKLPTGDSEIYFSCEAGIMNNVLLNLEKYYKGV